MLPINSKKECDHTKILNHSHGGHVIVGRGIHNDTAHGNAGSEEGSKISDSTV